MHAYSNALCGFFQDYAQNIARHGIKKKALCYNRSMDKSILNEVIAAEKEVQQRIEQEQLRLRQWLEQVKAECGEAVRREELNDGTARHEALTAARQDAEKQAQAVRDEAAALAARLEGLDEALLTGIVRKRLPALLLE